MRGGAAQAATASGVNQTVRLPRARRPASYSAQLVTRCCCLGMWRRQAALALNGTAEIRVSGKEPSSHNAQLPTPTGRSVQQGASPPSFPPGVPGFVSKPSSSREEVHLELDHMHWVIVGGESGPRARPMRREWVESVQRQCAQAGVAFFFKQWGGT